MRDEDRNKFVRLAISRVNKAIKSIQLVGNLSNKSNYDYSEDDVEKIFAVLQRELKACKSRFKNESGKSDKIFSL